MKSKTLLFILFTSAILHLSSNMAAAQCQAGFTYTVNAATASFTDISTYSTSVSYQWNFGDGYSDWTSNPSPHTYQYAGTYIVCLYISDSLPTTCSSSFCDTVVIVGAPNPPCNAVFTAYVDYSNPIVYFNNQATYNVQWLWDFGDGNTSTVQNPVHQYSVNATYSICLTAITIAGDTCSFCDTINSTPCTQLLSASFTHSYASNAVTFSSICSGDPTSTYYWSFGDGNYSSAQNPVHTYQYNGIYNVCLTYGDSMAGCSIMACDTVNITTAVNPPCNVYFNHYLDSIPTTQVYFYGYSSTQVTQWFWDFGDGNISTQQYPVHTFTTSGSYSVCLSVIRSVYGDTCTFCDTVNITIPGLLCGSVFSDANSNCVKNAGDTPLANWMVKAQETSLSTVFYGVANAAGNYTVTVPAGNYLVSLLPLNTYWNQVCPVSPSTYSVTVVQQATVSNLNFGMQPIVSCADLAASIGAGIQRRCFSNNYYVVQYSNNGTIAASNVLLKVDFDSPLGRIIPLSSTLPWDSISSTEYFWKLGTVNVGQSGSFTVTDSVSCGTVLGDTLSASVLILPIAGDCNSANNYLEVHDIVMGSYDPNEKKAATTSNKVFITQAFILATDTIDYHIGFQNTGSDTAFTVTVYDTLDSDLNIQSVISGVSTHPYTFQILGGNVLKWTFNNILLVDSNKNEPLSHGFFKFRILQKPNNPIGTVIKNSAGIVFDFNVPVITDTVVLTVGDPTGIEENGAVYLENSVSIYPNPTTGEFQIQVAEGSGSQYSLEIYNVYGEKVYEKSNGQLKMNNGQLSILNSPLSIDLSSQPSGIYFLHVKTEQETVNKKIIINK